MRLLALLLCLLSAQAWAACGSECWVDLAGTGSGAATGTSVSNQCAGIADTDCTPAAGSTVHLCGTGATISPQAVDGTRAGPIVYTASCSGGTTGTMSSAGQTYGVNITDRAWLTFIGLDVTGPNQAGYLVNCSVGNTSANVRIEDADVTSVAGNGATIGNGFRWFCADVTLWNTSVDGAWSDGYYCDTCDRAIVGGDRTRVASNGATVRAGWYAANFASGDGGGDGIQVVDGDDPRIVDGLCEHDGSGTKLCLIQSSASSTGGLARGNTLIGGVDAGLSWVAPNAKLIGNWIVDVGGINSSGAAVGIKLNGDGQYAIGNIVDGAKKCFFSQTASTSVHYVNNVCRDFSDRGLDANTAGAVTLEARNNVFRGADGLTSSNYAIIIGAGVTETIDYNAYDNLGSAKWGDSGTTYATLALWQAHSEDAHALSAVPGWAGGTAPTDPAGFCLSSTSALLAAGTYIGAYATGYGGEDLGKPPVIGARGLCRYRQPSAARAASPVRPLSSTRPVAVGRPR